MKKKIWFILGILLLVGILAAYLLYQIPAIKMRIDWRVDVASTYVRSLVDPVSDAPTALPQPQVNLQRNAGTPTIQVPIPFKPTSQPVVITPSPLPEQVLLPPPKYEKEVYNNCGAATLTMALRMFGWEGSQNDISSVIKPDEDDKNVNIDELVYYVRNKAGWLNAEYRVNGDIDLIRRLISNGLPLIIESGMHLDQSYRVNDDRWAGHYLLVTGYDDQTGLITTQDSWYSPNRMLAYSELDQNWKQFNRAYLLIYTPDQASLVMQLLGEDWDENANRENALNKAVNETSDNPEDAFAWFNAGTNLLYFERYTDAAQAYDTAIRLTLPQRMFRYQFGPFIAYFKTGRNDDLKALAEYALKITPTSEEDLLWLGWATYREGDKAKAIELFNKALHINPNYQDARYALNYVGGNTQ